jgi:hypothetical protein
MPPLLKKGNLLRILFYFFASCRYLFQCPQQLFPFYKRSAAVIPLKTPFSLEKGDANEVGTGGRRSLTGYLPF